MASALENPCSFQPSAQQRFVFYQDKSFAPGPVHPASQQFSVLHDRVFEQHLGGPALFMARAFITW